MQECATSPVQTTVELKSYIDDTSFTYYISDMTIDSNLNRYILHYKYHGVNTFMSKINAAGDFEWSKEYLEINNIVTAMAVRMTNNESTVDFIAKEPGYTGQYVRISACKYFLYNKA